MADLQQTAPGVITDMEYTSDGSQSDDDDDLSSSYWGSEDESGSDAGSEYVPSFSSESDYETDSYSSSSYDSSFSEEESVSSNLELNTPCHSNLPVEVWECIMLQMCRKEVPKMRLISKLHLSITQRTVFQSKYFLKHYSKCEAIYEATCRPKLFNGQLLQRLLAMGAIMSRHFVQCLNKSYMQREESDSAWTKALTKEAYSAVIAEGTTLYGETLNLSLQLEDWNALDRWTKSSDPSRSWCNELDEILHVGRFAPFSDSYNYECGRYLARRMIKYRPELVEVMRYNGYQWGYADIDSCVGELFQRYGYDPKALYRCISTLMDESPTWEASALLFRSLMINPFYFNLPFLNPVIATNAAQMQRIDYIRVIPAPVTVVKRIYEEGKGFQDLKKVLSSLIRAGPVDEDKIPLCVRYYRLLYHSFAPLMQEVREEIGPAYVQVWQDKQKLVYWPRGICSENETMMKQSLFHILKELDLTLLQTAQIFGRQQITPTILVPALEAGLFGPVWLEDLGSIVRILIEFYIRNPMNGKHLGELSSVVAGCNGLQYQDTKVNVGETFFADQLHTVLSSWSINLDRLLPDLISNTKFHFRSPIGWMVKSSIRRRNEYISNNHFIDETIPMDLADPHWLIDDISTEEDAELTFTITSDAIGLSLLKEPFDADADAAAAVTDDCFNREELEGLATIHGQAKEKDRERIDLCTRDTFSSSQAYDTNCKEIIKTEDEISISMTDKGSILDCMSAADEDIPYHTLLFSMDRWFSELRSSFNTVNGIEGKKDQEETWQVIIDVLGRDSLVIRDVLLAHVLANGNAELAEELMKGDYLPIDTAASTRPVLPTFSHLLIWQRLRRRPLKIYLDCILRGAPFRQGYVKSTLYSDSLVPAEGREQYLEDEYEDDERMVSLFDRKMALQKLDTITPQDQLADWGEMHSAKDKMDLDLMHRESSGAKLSNTSENKDGDGDYDMKVRLDLPEDLVPSNEEVHVVYDGYQRSLTLKELIRQKNSLKMWKDHLEVLLWIEEREKRTYDKDVRRYEEPSDPMKSFFVGLKDMVKKVEDMSVFMQHLLSEEIGKKKEAVVGIETMAEEIKRGIDMSSMSDPRFDAEEREELGQHQSKPKSSSSGAEWRNRDVNVKRQKVG